MKKIMIILFLMIVFSTLAYSEEQKIYDVTLKYGDGKILEKGVYLDYGYPGDDILQPSHAYRSEIKSFQGEKLHSYNFRFSLIIYTDPPTILEETEQRLFLPYFDNAEKIEIYYHDELVDEIDVSAYSNPGILEKHNPELAKFIKKSKRPEWQKPKWLIIIAAIIAIGALSFILIKKIRK